MDNNYWSKRFEKLEKASLEKGSKLYKELEKYYASAYREIEKDILKWYNRFAKDNNISFAEAKAMLTKGELKEFKWTLEEYINYASNKETNKLWAKQLKNASTRVHISRLDSLRIQIQNEMEKIYGKQLEGITEIAETIYEDNYYHTAYELQVGNNVAWKLTKLDNKAIQKVLTIPWTDGSNFSSKIWQNKDAMMEKLKTGLTQNFIRGNSPDELIKSIAKEFKTDLSKAGRLVMTESAFFSAEAQKDCFNDLGVRKYQILGTLDGTTCKECASYDLKIIDMKDYQEGVTAPPFHPWCRCTTIPYFGDEYEIGERAARNADGKTYYVPRNMKYEEWKEKYVYSDPEAKKAFELDVKKRKNQSSDYKQYNNYRSTLGNDVPKTFAEFQEMKYNNVKEYDYLKGYYRLFNSGTIPKDLTYNTYKNNLENNNWKAVGLNPNKLQSHFDKHGAEFNIKTAEEYEKYAKDFMNKEIKDNIEGFVNDNGYVFKYDNKNNIFGTAKPTGITETIFKPKNGKDYWKEQIDRYGKQN